MAEPKDTGGRPAEDVKAKFREALERKRASQHPTAEGEANSGAVHNSNPLSASQRTFRRKSG